MVYPQDHNQKQQDTAVIIGGSLSGLMTAIALSDQGIQVTVLEKAKEGQRNGGGLQVDGDSFRQTKIEKKLRQLVSKGKSTIQLWTSIESRLRKEAYDDPNITLYYDTRVQSVHQDGESTWAKTDEGQLFEADILIGADGHRSIVRKKVAPHHPNAEFAGYVVWMASVPEDELPIEGSEIPKKDLDALAEQAKARWSDPWLTATLHAIESRSFIGIPIKEYVPETLAHERFALVGDAAHVPAPITASGFNESLKDAVILSECASDGLQGSNASTTLKKYEDLRLKKVQKMVQSGRSFSRSFGQYK